MVTHCIKLN